MNTSHLLRWLLVISSVLGSAGIPVAQSARTTAATPNAPPSGTTTPKFEPGLDDFMTMLVQPRHIKLYYAGTQKNWELAAAEAHDLRLAFAHIALVVPKYMGIGVDEALRSIMAPKLQAVDAAIAAAEPKQFLRAYDDLTAACNSCHEYMEHSFHVIKTPTAAPSSMYADQEFGATP